jgi:hypothetical protein
VAGTRVSDTRTCHDYDRYELIPGQCLCVPGNRFNHGRGRLLAQRVLVLRIATTVGANRARREKRSLAAGANFTGQGVTLLFETPVTRNFHCSFILSSTTIKMIAAFLDLTEQEDTFSELSNPIKSFLGTIN